MKYFTYDLPRELPYLDPTAKTGYESTIRRVSARMDTLEEALNMTGLPGAAFAATARKLFDAFKDSGFDSWDAPTLANMVMTAYSPGTSVQERIEFPNAVTVVDSAFVKTEEWEAIRHIGIGGSDAAVVIGTTPWRDPMELYYDKRGVEAKIPQPDDGKSAIFERGHVIEERVIEAFCNLTGAHRTHETRMFRSKRYPHATANPDDIITFPDGRIFVFEAKTSAVDNEWHWSGDRIPKQYIPQMRQYPGVLDDDRIIGTYISCHFTVDYTLHSEYVGSSIDGSKFTSKILERDPVEENELMEREEQFWADYIENGTVPPSNCGPEKELELLRTYVTGPADKSSPAVTFSDEWKARFEELNDITVRRKTLQQQVDRLKELEKSKSIDIIQALGTAVKGTAQFGSDLWTVKYIPKAGKTVDFEKLEKVYPEAFSACVTVNPEKTRVFSLGRKTIKAANPV